MSMGYPAAQGYTGNPASPTAPAGSGIGFNQAMAGVGLLIQGLGTWQQGSAQKSMAVSGKRSAAHALKETQRQARYDQWLISKRIASKHGEQRAAFAGAGLELSGTALQVMKESLLNMNRDKAMTKYNAEQKALGLKRAYRDYKRAEKSAGLSQAIGIAGTAIGAGVLLFSDVALKENIQPVENAMAKIRELAAYEYNYKGNDLQCIGLLAQEVQKVLPDAVRGQDGLLAVDLYRIQSLIVSALNEIQE